MVRCKAEIPDGLRRVPQPVRHRHPRQGQDSLVPGADSRLRAQGIRLLPAAPRHMAHSGAAPGGSPGRKCGTDSHSRQEHPRLCDSDLLACRDLRPERDDSRSHTLVDGKRDKRHTLRHQGQRLPAVDRHQTGGLRRNGKGVPLHPEVAGRCPFLQFHAQKDADCVEPALDRKGLHQLQAGAADQYAQPDIPDVSRHPRHGRIHGCGNLLLLAHEARLPRAERKEPPAGTLLGRPRRDRREPQGYEPQADRGQRGQGGISRPLPFAELKLPRQAEKAHLT